MMIMPLIMFMALDSARHSVNIIHEQRNADDIDYINNGYMDYSHLHRY